MDPEHVALTGLHSWTDDDFLNVAAWGLSTFTPDELHTSSMSLLDRVTTKGCSKVATQLDVDIVDSDELVIGLGMAPHGLWAAESMRTWSPRLTSSASPSRYTFRGRSSTWPSSCADALAVAGRT